MNDHLDIANLPSLAEAGFSGGRDNFREFCRTIFRLDEPRFLRNDQNQLVVFRHEDLQAFGTAPQIGNLPIGKLYPARFTSDGSPARGLGSGVADVISSQVFTFNPPLHGPARQILIDWLGPKQIAVLEKVGRQAAHAVLDQIQHSSPLDFVSAIAERLTISFWSSLLHLTESEADTIGACTREMTRLFRLGRNADDLQALDLAFAEYARILDDVATRRLAAKDPDLTAIAEKLATLRSDDDPFAVGVAPKSVGQLLAGNLVDGFHTTALATANTFCVLARDPNAMTQVRNSPQLAAKAIAEALRIEPPIILLKRYALEDFTYRGKTIPAGSIVTMLWAAGNYDPSVFPDPERFDINRLHAGLTTFGKGIHICPGRHLGVMLIRVLLDVFLEKDIEVELSGDRVTWIPRHMVNQLSAMPAIVKRRTG
ncbi:cytochrome P450 [Mesorhizobium sp. M2C.T.Ca.TU.002.02.1.1]|uniref:cytochrome P450 n=1 Tax=Mesorhizobium sp. M2C.T.Ca.TU.002.02.1.1 TaxID=2496788 RepID=UPI000FCB25DA|nr:cytochrome P450 [Mesorhizobium sp. M2C.T.Ca.TU.002.02.1.1]RUU57256.1 cytochrome P450 [Mesorhizobium sp. M2C.T.Ca.TU.002.02.1.1]